MTRAIVASLAAAVLGLVMVPAPANAQLGTPLYTNPMLRSNQHLDDYGRRAGKETSANLIRDVERALTDASPKVRIDGLVRLRFVRDPKVTELLMKGLADPDTRVRVKAVDILGARQTTDAVPSMSQLLFLRSTEPVVKLHISAALGRIGDARGVLAIVQYLQESQDERSRGTAVYALGEIGDSRANAALTKTATEDASPMVRRLAQEALEKIEGELPSQKTERAKATDKRWLPTDARLSKLREVDAAINSSR